MKRVERINTIMRYINNRAHFTVSEIVQEFNVSRSTAIRDIREIEAIGMPLLAEVGRGGGYFVMQNSVLPLVRFTDSELKALFIAFMATRNQQLPYLKSRQSLAEKLLGLISESQCQGRNVFDPFGRAKIDPPQPVYSVTVAGGTV